MQPLTRRSAIRAVAGGLGLLTFLHPDPGSAQTPRLLEFELYKSGKEFRWRLKAGNGQKIANGGEPYTTKAACQEAIERVRAGAATATIEDLTAKATP